MHLRKKDWEELSWNYPGSLLPKDWLSQYLKELYRLPSEKSNQKFCPDGKTINHNNGPKGAITAFTSWGQPTLSGWT